MPNKIIARANEQAELESVFNSSRAELVALYGRRRIGKTFLLKNFFKKKSCFFLYVLGIKKGNLEQQLSKFTESLSETFYHGALLQPAKSWMDAFKQLTDAIANIAGRRKVVVFLDELPWLATRKSGLLQALEYYWNKCWTDNNKFKLIVCGSTTSWIISNIINNKGGLHNRVTKQMLLEPFNLHEIDLYLKHLGYSYSKGQTLELYMMLGGIPYYLQQLKRKSSIAKNINDLCFKSTGTLFNEFDKVLKGLFEDAEKYEEIIRLIAKSRNGISRATIEEKATLSSKGGTLSTNLKQLEETGFILSFLPMGRDKKGIYYKVIDEYTLFYLTWIEYIKSTLLKKETGTQYWKEQINTAGWHTWCGYAFEAVCYKHIGLIRKALDISAGANVGTWKYIPKKGSKDNGAQIDLLFDSKDAITVCEIKYTAKPFIIDKQYAQQLVNKRDVYKKQAKIHKEIFIAFISANGIKTTMYSEELISGVVTLEDLFL